MKIKNVSTHRLVIGDLLSASGRKGVTLSPGAEAIVYDEDAEKSKNLASLMTDGKIIKLSEEEPLESSPAADPIGKLITWINSGDMLIQFANPINGTLVNDYPSAAVGSPVSVGLAITNGDGVIDTFNSSATVIVSASLSGTVNAAPSALVTFADGYATFTVTDSVAETVTLTLAGGNTSLDKTDTATIQFA